VDHHAVDERQLWSRRSRGELGFLGDDVWQRLYIVTNQGMYHGGILATVRQGVRRCVLAPRVELHRELESEEVADPRMLWDRRQALIKQVLEAEMICVHDEWASLEIRPPVLHDLDQPDQLPLVGGELGVVGSDGAAIESQRSGPLM
jgi:hypothetical protein